MNIKKLFLGSFVSFSILAIACTKQIKKNATIDVLEGTWQWVSTDGGIAFHIHSTPVSTGKNIDLKVTRDGKYYFYTNDTLTSQGTYLLRTQNCIHDHTDKSFIEFSSGTGMMIEKLETNELSLSDEAFDGTGSFYIRKK